MQMWVFDGFNQLVCLCAKKDTQEEMLNIAYLLPKCLGKKAVLQAWWKRDRENTLMIMFFSATDRKGD